MSINRNPVSWSHVHTYTNVYKYVIQLNAIRSVTVVYPNHGMYIYLLTFFFCTFIHFTNPGADPGEVKWVNFHPPLFLSPLLSFFLYPSNNSTRLWFYYIITKIHPPPHFKILNPRLKSDAISGIKSIRDLQWLV